MIVLQSFIYQTKPKTSHVQHVEYEPDLLTHAREKRGVKIGTNFWTPCRMEAVMREKRRRRGEAILCEHFYLYLRFHHLSRGL